MSSVTRVYFDKTTEATITQFSLKRPSNARVIVENKSGIFSDTVSPGIKSVQLADDDVKLIIIMMI